MVVRGPAGLEAGLQTKLFIIQLKLKVKRTHKGISKTKADQALVTLKLTLLLLVSELLYKVRDDQVFISNPFLDSPALYLFFVSL